MSATPMMLALVLLVGTALPSQAQDSSDDAFSKIPWQTGPILGDLGKQAQVAVPDNCVFTGEKGTREFMELTENPVNARVEPGFTGGVRESSRAAPRLNRWI